MMIVCTIPVIIVMVLLLTCYECNTNGKEVYWVFHGRTR